MPLAIFSGILGLVVGSFLNVVVNRIKLKETLQGRSHCPRCKKPLKAYHLVPLFSYIFLRGRCAYCKKPISLQYPLVEAGTSLMFIFVSLQYGASYIDALFLWVIGSALIVIGVYDFKHYIIPDKVVLPAIGVALIYALYKDFAAGCAFSWDCATVSGLIGVVVISGFFLAQYIYSQGTWIGFGDVKFGILLGLMAGFISSIILLFFAYMFGALFGIYLIATGKKELTSKMPFGVFLAAIGLLIMIWGSDVTQWYLDLIGF